MTSLWDELIGQDEAVAVLRDAARAAAVLVSERGSERGSDAASAGNASAFTHAWLFTGPAGSGRSVAARVFAAALECERVADPGCGECTACHTVRAGTHPDVRIMNPEGLSISVKETREIVQQSARLPATGRWQVVIIEDADRLGERAFNALLKAIEEPAPRTVFMLCSPSSHPDDIAVTIRSRCRLVGLRTPPAAAVAAVLERSGIDGATASWAAAAGQGHVGRSRRLAVDAAAREHRATVLAIPASLTSLRACLQAADQLVSAAKAEADAVSGERDADELEALNNALGIGATGKGTAASVRGTAGAIKDLEKRQKSRATRTVRDSLDRALVDLAAFYRDVLLVHAGTDVPRAHPDFDDDVRAVAARVPSAGVLRRLDAVLACRTALELNVKPEIAVEAMTAALRLP
ncbi:DNA polymerase III subunit delta' [Jatrophihabitans cynanchi]|uniref:DNA polymerase III subunit delta n=1 Tax=Jatrophihabitans cynanchi TaxID=2944128 RepID=A0ABY7K6A1_9ACTN|nr:DNA polymerase III subunit delta' [Jatrophihabitans sp. SB3-54]WAX59137.1 DNA polymerase III subunit delta' [Jatrophihabitans sp. SB3-54]